MSASLTHSARPQRISLAVSDDLIRELDRHVSAGVARSRTELINDAIERELQRLEREAVDAEFLAAAADSDYLKSDQELADEFEGSDAETWKALDEIDGGFSESR